MGRSRRLCRALHTFHEGAQVRGLTLEAHSQDAARVGHLHGGRADAASRSGSVWPGLLRPLASSTLRSQPPEPSEKARNRWPCVRTVGDLGAAFLCRDARVRRCAYWRGRGGDPCTWATLRSTIRVCVWRVARGGE